MIISARSSFEEEFPGDFHRWKVEAFKSIKKYFDTDVHPPPKAADYQPHVRRRLQHRDGSCPDPCQVVYADAGEDHQVPGKSQTGRACEAAGAGQRQTRADLPIDQESNDKAGEEAKLPKQLNQRWEHRVNTVNLINIDYGFGTL